MGRQSSSRGSVYPTLIAVLYPHPASSFCPIFAVYRTPRPRRWAKGPKGFEGGWTPHPYRTMTQVAARSSPELCLAFPARFRLWRANDRFRASPPRSPPTIRRHRTEKAMQIGTENRFAQILDVYLFIRGSGRHRIDPRNPVRAKALYICMVDSGWDEEGQEARPIWECRRRGA